MKIVAVEEVPLADEPVEALIPRLEAVKSQEKDAGFTLTGKESYAKGGDPQVGVLDMPYSLERSPHLSPSSSGGYTFKRTSMSFSFSTPSVAGLPGLGGSSTWKVADLAPIGDGFAEIALDRPGGGSFLAAAYEDDLADLATGAPVVGMDSVLERAEHKASAGELSFGTPIDIGMKYVLRFIKVRVDFVPDQPPTDAETLVPVVRTHCPDVEGCRAEFSTSTIGSGSQTTTLGLLGSSGRTQHQITFQEGTALPALPGACSELALPGVVEIQSGTTRLEEDPIAYGVRVTLRSIDSNDVREQEIPAEFDSCGWSADQLPPDAEKRDRSQVKTDPVMNPTFSKRVAEQTSGTLSIGLMLNKSPLTLGLDFDRTSTTESSVSAWLAPGASYAAYQPGKDRTMEWCWTVLPRT